MLVNLDLQKNEAKVFCSPCGKEFIEDISSAEISGQDGNCVRLGKCPDCGTVYYCLAHDSAITDPNHPAPKLARVLCKHLAKENKFSPKVNKDVVDSAKRVHRRHQESISDIDSLNSDGDIVLTRAKTSADEARSELARVRASRSPEHTSMQDSAESKRAALMREEEALIASRMAIQDQEELASTLEAVRRMRELVDAGIRRVSGGDVSVFREAEDAVRRGDSKLARRKIREFEGRRTNQQDRQARSTKDV